MRLLKQSTAYNLNVFMADSSDHITGKTGLTLTITASKDGAAFASVSPTVTELSSGWYKLALTSSHTDTVGDLALHITSTGADATDMVMQVRANVLGDTLPANVTQFGGTAGAFSNGMPRTLPQGMGKTYYVAASGGNDSNSGLDKANPKATVASAYSAATYGDTIWMLSGTYADDGTNPFLTIAKDGITLRGDGSTQTIINCTAFDGGLFLNGDHVTVRDIKVNATAAGGSCIFAIGKFSWVENCYLSCTENTYTMGTSAYGATVKNCYISAGRYGMKGDSEGFLFENCYVTCNCAFTYTANSDFVAFRCFKQGTIRNCYAGLIAVATTSTGKMIGVVAETGPVTIDGVYITALNLSSNLTGGVRGITRLTGSSTPVVADVRGGAISLTNSAFPSAVYDIDANYSGSYVRVGGTKYDITKCTGTAYLHEDLQPATPGRTLVVDSAGIADANAVKVGPSGSGTAQTAADLGLAVGTVQARLGVPNGADIAADIAGLPAALLATTNGAASVATQLAHLDGDVSDAGAGAADTRDLQPTQFTWEIARRSDGTLVSTNTLRIAPGETIRAGFNCNRQLVLPTGVVLASMTNPTSTATNVTATKLGVDPTNAKVSVAAASNAVGGTTGYVRTTVTNSSGAGPITLLGKIEVVAEP